MVAVDPPAGHGEAAPMPAASSAWGWAIDGVAYVLDDHSLERRKAHRNGRERAVALYHARARPTAWWRR